MRSVCAKYAPLARALRCGRLTVPMVAPSFGGERWWSSQKVSQTSRPRARRLDVAQACVGRITAPAAWSAFRRGLSLVGDFGQPTGQESPLRLGRDVAERLPVTLGCFLRPPEAAEEIRAGRGEQVVIG
jgi:hypothetical protein